MNQRQEPIEVVSPTRMFNVRKESINKAIKRVLSSGNYILGKECSHFESEFSQYLGVNYSTCVGNGTDALVLALKAIGISTGDEIITVSNTAVATVAAIRQAGAHPVFVDINADSRCMEPDALASAITHKTRAIIPVHLYGQPADMHAIMKIADHAGVFVIEDCAQAHGAMIDDIKVGSFGNAAAFSFYPTKNLAALGDCGAVVTNNLEISEYTRKARQYGWDSNKESQFDGLNSRMDEIQAAILRVNLTHLNDDTKRRRNIAQRYDECLKFCPGIKAPSLQNLNNHSMHLYVIECDNRKSLCHYLHSLGINTGIHYPKPVHKHKAYLTKSSSIPSLPITERLSKTVVSLPMHPFLTENEIDRVCYALNAWST